jgi:thioredoxin reductase (NADPH)
VLIVGAGPAGLAAAIAARNAGLVYRVLEKGILTNSIFNYPKHMVFFTTPELLEIGDLPFTTPYEKPTRVEALRYYRRVVDLLTLEISLNERVEAVVPPVEDGELFRVETRLESAEARTYRSRNVVFATGYYDNPNLLGIPGEGLPHVSHYYSEPHPYYRKKVIVVGARNSAAEAALDLYRAGAAVTLVHRAGALSEGIKYWVRPDLENRMKEGSIAARFNTCVREIRHRSVVVESAGRREEIAADAVFLLTGFHPDVDLLCRAGVRIDPATLIPAHDPETLETNVPGLFLAGSVVSGRQTNRIFIENGRLHGDMVVRTILTRHGLHESV